MGRTSRHDFSKFILRRTGTLTGILPPSHTNVHEDRHDDVHPTLLQVRGVVRHHPCPSEEHGGEVGGSSTRMEQGVPERHRKSSGFSLALDRRKTQCGFSSLYRTFLPITKRTVFS